MHGYDIPRHYYYQAGFYKPKATHARMLAEALPALRAAAPFASRRDVIQALPAHLRWSGWITDLVVKDNRTVRFDFMEAIEQIDPSVPRDEAWQEVTKGAYERSPAAALAFDLLWLHHTTKRPPYKPPMRREPAPTKRPEQSDGPKRRRFRLTDRDRFAKVHRYPCRCSYCRPDVTKGRGDSKRRAITEQED